MTTTNASVFRVPIAPAGCSSASPFRGGWGRTSGSAPAGPPSGVKPQPSHVVDFPDAGGYRLGPELGVQVLRQLDAALLLAVDGHEPWAATDRLEVRVELRLPAVRREVEPPHLRLDLDRLSGDERQPF